MSESVFCEAAPPVLVGAGDIATCQLDSDESTAALLDTIPGTVFTAADNAYPDGPPAEFADCYGRTWGRHRGRTRPAAGNHDYDKTGAAGYYEYFGSSAGAPSEGYYSFDLGTWHVVVLNSNLEDVDEASQLALAGSRLVHEFVPFVRSGVLALIPGSVPVFTETTSRVDPHLGCPSCVGVSSIALSGHDHHYERFAPPGRWSARWTRPAGIRQFVVSEPVGSTCSRRPSSRPTARFDWPPRRHGVLKLSLASDFYRWEFVAWCRHGEVVDCRGGPRATRSEERVGALFLVPRRGRVSSLIMEGRPWSVDGQDTLR